MRSARWWIALASGLLLAAVFPPFDLHWLCMPFAIAGWFAVTAGVPLRTALWRSFAFAMAFYLVLLKWMLIVGIDAWILLALLQSLYFLLVPIFRHRAGEWALPVATIAWVTQDWLRDNAPFAAFGWGQLAFAKVDAPWAGLAPFGGQSVVTAIVVLAGCGLGSLVVGTPAHRLIGVGGAILALAAPVLLPANILGAPDGRRLALVQGGVEHTGLGFIGDRNAVLFRHRDLTEVALRGTDAIGIVWPENAADSDPFTDQRAARALHTAADAAGQPILFGAVLTEPSGRRNMSLLVRPRSTDLEPVYQKQRLVPFGEFLPMRDFLTRVTDRVQFLPIDFRPGNDPADLRLSGFRFGIVICFEIADQQLVSNALATSQDALIVQTNNATYAATGQSEQQLRISQFRARMFRVPVYVVSTNGPTAIIDEQGRVTDRIAEGDSGVIYASLRRSRT